MTHCATPDATDLKDTDIAVVFSAARNGEPAAWTELVRRYRPVIQAAVVPFRLGDADTADVVQTTWLRLLEYGHSVRDPERLGGWLATTARRESLAVLRRRRGEILVDTDRDTPIRPDPGVGRGRRRHVPRGPRRDRGADRPAGAARRRALRPAPRALRRDLQPARHPRRQHRPDPVAGPHPASPQAPGCGAVRLSRAQEGRTAHAARADHPLRQPPRFASPHLWVWYAGSDLPGRPPPDRPGRLRPPLRGPPQAPRVRLQVQERPRHPPAPGRATASPDLPGHTGGGGEIWCRGDRAFVYPVRSARPSRSRPPSSWPGSRSPTASTCPPRAAAPASARPGWPTAGSSSASTTPTPRPST